jgi:hypothetical protein
MVFDIRIWTSYPQFNLLILDTIWYLRVFTRQIPTGRNASLGTLYFSRKCPNLIFILILS